MQINDLFAAFFSHCCSHSLPFDPTFRQKLICCMRPMYHIFAATAYLVAEFICCLTLATIVIRQCCVSLSKQRFTCPLSVRKFAVEFLVFALVTAHVNFLIVICQRWKFQSEETLSQLFICLLGSLLLINLSTEVCNSLC